MKLLAVMALMLLSVAGLNFGIYAWELQRMDQCVRDAAVLDYADVIIFASTQGCGWNEDSAWMATAVFHETIRVPKP